MKQTLVLPLESLYQPLVLPLDSLYLQIIRAMHDNAFLILKTA